MKLTQGLVLDLPFADGSNSRFKDTVSGAYGKWTGSPPTGYNSLYGTYMDLDGSSDYGQFTLTAKQQKLTQVTIEIIQSADDVNQYVRPFHIGTTGDRTHSIEMDNGWGFVFNANWSGGGGAWSIPKPNVGDIDHFFWTYDWGSTSNDPIIYKNGLSQTVTERASPSGTANNDYTMLWVGCAEDASQKWNGKIYLIRMWRRILTAGEITILTNNPYCIYKSNSNFIQRMVGKVASGASYTKSFSDDIFTISEPSFLRSLTKTFPENITLSEPIFSKGSARIHSETITIIDTLSKIYNKFTTFTETITITDTFSKIQARFKALTETVTMSDTFSKSFVFYKNVTDTITMTDVMSILSALGLLFTDTIYIKDWLWRWKRNLVNIWTRRDANDIDTGWD